MSKHLRTTGIWGLVGAMAASGVALAALPQQDPNSAQQQPRVNRTGEFNQRGATGTMAVRNDLDHYLVKVLIQANTCEVETARLAEQRSTNADIKSFAKRAIEDHSQFTTRLEAFRGHNRQGQPQAQFQQGRPQFQQGQSQTQFQQGQAGQTATQPGTVAPTQQPAETAQVEQDRRPHLRGDVAMNGQHGSDHRFIKIMDQVAMQTHQTMMRELSQKEGAHFDRAFLGSQIGMHVWLVDALTVFEQNASPALRPVIQEGLQTAREHLTHAKDILARMDQGTTKSAANHDAGRFGTR